MTKTVRIENADTSTFKVKIRVEDRKWDAESGKLSDEWITVKTVDLAYPTSMFSDYITSTRRFIVEEMV